MADLTFFFRSLKGHCHGNQFWGKIAYPTFRHSSGVPNHVLRFFSGRPNLASLPKSCNLLVWDLGYSEATDQVRWMRASPVAAAWLSRVPCAPVHCLVGTRSRQVSASQFWHADQNHQLPDGIQWFGNTNISQGSVATRLRPGGSLLIILLQIFNWVRRWKNYENRPIFSKDMDKSIVSPFFWLTVYIQGSVKLLGDKMLLALAMVSY